MTRVPVTVVIPTLNEAGQIAECVRQAAWADEVLVADAGSADATVALAREAGATVLEHTGPTIAAQRNAAIAAARNGWVFALDADERFTPELVEAIGGALAAPAHGAYRVWRRNYYLGWERTRGSWGRDRVVRLFPKERRYVERRVHEGLEPVPDVGDLTGRLVHHPYRDLAHHLEKIAKYARWGAEDLYDRGRRARWSDLIFRPAYRFVRAWILSGDWVEGRLGLVSATLDAYSVFLKYASLWALEGERRGVTAPGAGR